MHVAYTGHMRSLQERDILILGHRVHIFTAGQEHGRTLVLVHGIGVSTRYFGPFIEEMARDCAIVSIDLPGFGASSRPDELLTIQDYADVIEGCTKALGIIQPVFIGHSMGCQVVAEVLKRHPRITDRAVFLGPTVDAERRSVLRHIGLLFQECFREPWRLNKIILSDYWHCGIRRYLQTLGPMLADHIEEKCVACPAKILVMRGERDGIVRHEWAAKLAASIPLGEFREVADSAHVLQFTHPQETAAACREFIAS
jgi:pimeloyl-ACP methyl ester carboxylesterase